jgi:hypothetical protein
MVIKKTVRYGGQMAETKTKQKGWRFTPETVLMLTAIRMKDHKRPEQSMVEVLIEDRYAADFGNMPIMDAIESVSKSRVADVNS